MRFLFSYPDYVGDRLKCDYETLVSSSINDVNEYLNSTDLALTIINALRL